jgi:hypothetical protein
MGREHLPPEPIRKTEDKKYPCIFRLDEDCPVRKEFKLKPENLVKWCKICPILHQEYCEIEKETEKE